MENIPGTIFNGVISVNGWNNEGGFKLIDLIVEVPAVPYEDLHLRREAEPSSEVKKRVNAARTVQRKRYGNGGMTNARMGAQELRRYCALDDSANMLLRNAFVRLGMTARSYDRVVKVARTIADLEGSDTIKFEHVAEAINYRRVNLGNP